MSIDRQINKLGNYCDVTPSSDTSKTNDNYKVKPLFQQDIWTFCSKIIYLHGFFSIQN